MSLSDAAWTQLISATHTSGRKAALAITGGGTGAAGELLRIPGGSQLLIEVQVPYSEQALESFLGFAPSQACSAETAIAMAHRARSRALAMEAADANLVGLGATAALVSDRPRRGEHRFHIACAGAEGVSHCTVVLAKGRRDRAAEEALVARAIILWLARACGVDAPPVQSLLGPDEQFTQADIAAGDTIDALLAGSVNRVTALPDGQLVLAAAPPALVMPGSFNPVHDGHIRLARTASDIRQHPMTFEMSVTNVDKPPLTGEVVRHRLRQFAWKSPVELTRAPTFLEKSRLFPGATFVVGADTAERLVAMKYYGHDEDRMLAALEEIGQSGGNFLVAVRIDSSGRLLTLRDIPIPQRFVDLFAEIPEHLFRLDLSSSAIRQQGGA
jgi:nicotinamide mononucleotide (NMN) deamidase PncC